MNKVYIARTDKLNDDIMFGRLYNAASRRRREKTDKFLFRKDKMLSLAAEALLRKALADIGIRHFELEYGRNGKPYIRDKNIFFNLSHSEDTVMCAVSEREIGADVEKVTDIDIEIAKRFFHCSEYEMIIRKQTNEEKYDMFFRLWTLKESFVKATGLGMEIPPYSFCIDIKDNDKISVRQNVNQETYYFKEYDFNDGYKYAVCGLSPYFEDKVEFVTFMKEI
ncbi:MAG: 4'-phosphopantetheinyl transferase family protein [Candidatus Ornithomonoglobus sp.]